MFSRCYCRCSEMLVFLAPTVWIIPFVNIDVTNKDKCIAERFIDCIAYPFLTFTAKVLPSLSSSMGGIHGLCARLPVAWWGGWWWEDLSLYSTRVNSGSSVAYYLPVPYPSTGRTSCLTDTKDDLLYWQDKSDCSNNGNTCPQWLNECENMRICPLANERADMHVNRCF
jgi:hypothetical protein